jgi:hypothetical protein
MIVSRLVFYWCTVHCSISAAVLKLWKPMLRLMLFLLREARSLGQFVLFLFGAECQQKRIKKRSATLGLASRYPF